MKKAHKSMKSYTRHQESGRSEVGPGRKAQAYKARNRRSKKNQ
jgi:hypothetical protein